MSEKKVVVPIVKFIDTVTHQNTAFYRFRVFVGDFRWIIERRFAQFFKLDANLRLLTGAVLPGSLPPRTIFNAHPSPAVVQERATKLTAYLTAALNEPSLQSSFFLLRFLSLSPEDLRSEGQHVKSPPTKIPMIKSGFLTKIGEVVKSFKIRLFVLADNLYYFKEHDHVNPIGSIILGKETTLEKMAAGDKAHPHGFYVITPKRKWQLYANDSKEVSEWMKAIQQVIDTEHEAVFSLVPFKRTSSEEKKARKDEEEELEGSIFDRRISSVAPVFEQVDQPKISSSSQKKWKPIFFKYAAEDVILFPRLQPALADAGFDFEKIVVDEVVREAMLQLIIDGVEKPEGLPLDMFFELLNCILWINDKFNSAEKNREDEITRDSLQNTLDSVGFDFEESLVTELYEIVDPHGSGVLDFDSFAHLFFWLRYHFKNFTRIAKKESGGFVSDGISADGLLLLCADSGFIPQPDPNASKLKQAGGVLNAVAFAVSKFGGKKGPNFSAAAAAAAFADGAATGTSIDDVLKTCGFETIVQFNIVQAVVVLVTMFVKEKEAKRGKVKDANEAAAKSIKRMSVGGQIVVNVDGGIISAVANVFKKQKKGDETPIFIASTWNSVSDISTLATYHANALHPIKTIEENEGYVRPLTWEQPIKGEIRCIKVSVDMKIIITVSFVGFGVETGNGLIIVQAWDVSDHTCIFMTTQMTQEWMCREDAVLLENTVDISPVRPFEYGTAPPRGRRLFNKGMGYEVFDKNERCRLLANLAFYRVVEIWDVLAGKLFCRLTDGNGPPFYETKFLPDVVAPDGAITSLPIIYVSDSEMIHEFNYVTNEKIRDIEHPATAITVSPKGLVFGAAGIGADKSKLKLWDGRAKKRLSKMSLGFNEDSEKDKRMRVIHNPVKNQIVCVDAIGSVALWNYAQEEGDETMTLSAINSAWTNGRIEKDGPKKYLKDIDQPVLSEASGFYHDLGGPAFGVSFSVDGEKVLVITTPSPNPSENVKDDVEPSKLAGLAAGKLGGALGSALSDKIPSSIGGVSVPKVGVKGMAESALASMAENAVGKLLGSDDGKPIEPSPLLLSLQKSPLNQLLHCYVAGLTRYSAKRVLGQDENDSEGNYIVAVYSCESGDLLHTIPFSPDSVVEEEEEGGLDKLDGALGGMKAPTKLKMPKVDLGTVAGAVSGAVSALTGSESPAAAIGPKSLHARFTMDGKNVVMSYGARMWLEKLPVAEEEKEKEKGGGLMGSITSGLASVDIKGITDKKSGLLDSVVSTDKDVISEEEEKQKMIEDTKQRKKEKEKEQMEKKKKKNKYSHLPNPILYHQHLAMMAIYEDNHRRLSDIVREYDIDLDFFSPHLSVSPLILAVSLGSAKIVSKLLQLGADPSLSRQYDGLTALHVAIFTKKHRISQKLVEAGASITALWRPFGYGFKHICLEKRMVVEEEEEGKKKKEKKKDVPFICNCGLCDACGLSAVHLSIIVNDDDGLHILMKVENPSPNVMDSAGRLPIEYAVAMRSFKLLTILITHKSALKTMDGVPIMVRAALNGDEDLMKVLQDGGADPNELGKDGRAAAEVLATVKEKKE